MNIVEPHYRRGLWFRSLCWSVLFIFGSDMIGIDLARALVGGEQSAVMLPPGTLMPVSSTFAPPILKAISIDPNDPFKIDFVVDAADQNRMDEGDQEQLKLLSKYFLSFLTLPEKDLWVNLSPYENDRIIAPDLEVTDAGRDMLVQDYTLKQLTASLTYPDREPGKTFWKKVLDRAQAEFGTSNIPINSYNKVWVVPDRAIVYEDGGTAFITESRLKVLLEEDYLSTGKNSHGQTIEPAHREKIDKLSSDIARQIIVPELEREVNEGKYFAPLRQMHHSLILAIWFKKRLKEHLINQLYSNQKKTSGIALDDTQIKERVYAQYLRAMKKGVYNFIREDRNADQEIVPRKYFSGGFSFAGISEEISFRPLSRSEDSAMLVESLGKNVYRFTLSLSPVGLAKKTLLALALAGAMSSTVASAPSTGNAQPLHVKASQIVAPHVSQSVIKLGDRIPDKDQKYFSFLKTFLGPTDVTNLDGRTNRLTGHAYRIDSPYFEHHWGDVFGSDELTWAPQAGLVAAQEKLGVPADGQLGPETRAALDEKMAQAGPAKIFEQHRTVSQAAPAPTPARRVVHIAPPASVPTVNPVPIQKLASAPTVLPKQPTLIPVFESSAHVINPPTAVTNVTPNSVNTTVAAIPVEDHLVARNRGIITGFDASKREYREGEVIFRLSDPELDGQINEITADLKIQERQLTELKVLAANGSASGRELDRVTQRVNTLNQELSKAHQGRAVGVVTAPHTIRVKDIHIANGMDVAKGMDLFSYYDGQRIRVDLRIPLGMTNFSRVQVSLNGTAVRSIESAEWSPTPDQRSARVSMVLTPSSMINMGQQIKLTVTTPPPQNSVSTLDSIRGQAETVAQVRKVDDIVLLSPTPGPVRFLVREGDRVRTGQIVAVVNSSPYVDQYNSIVEEIKGLDTQIARSAKDANGNHMGREQADQLKGRRAQLAVQLGTLKGQVSRTNILAPSSGVVSWTAANGSGVFASQDELLRIGSNTAIIGDINNSNQAVLFPEAIAIKNGEAVIVQTPDGTRVAGRVSGVNRTPYSSNMNLQGVQAVEVTAVDAQHILRAGLPVKVIIPTAGERPTITIARPQATPPSSRPVLSTSQNILNPIPTPVNPSVQSLNVRPGQIYQAPQAGALSPADVEREVAGNYLIGGTDNLEVLIKQAAAKLPKENSLSLEGGIFITPEGKLAFGGGLKGKLMGIGGSLLTGNALGAIGAVATQFWSHASDVINNKQGKETVWNQKMAERSAYYAQGAAFEHANQVTNLLIEIGAAQQRIFQLESLVGDLERAEDVTAAREEGGFSLTTDKNTLERNIRDARAQLLSLKGKEQSLSVELNNLRGKIDLHAVIPAAFPWAGRFTKITLEQEHNMFNVLTGDDSQNPRLLEARKIQEAMTITIDLQRKSRFPRVDFSDLHLSDVPNKAVTDVAPPGIRLSGIKQAGNTAGVMFSVDLKNSTQKTEAEIIALEKSKVELNTAKVKAKLAKELAGAVSQINSLSDEIQQAEESYTSAGAAWALKASRPDLYTPDQMVDESLRMDEAKQGLVKTKAGYFKAQGKLRELGLSEQAAVLVQEAVTPNTKPIAITTAARRVATAVAGTESTPEITPLPSLSSGSGVLPRTGQGGPQGGYLTPGSVTYSGGNAATLWALMSHENPSGPSVGSPRSPSKDPTFDSKNHPTEITGVLASIQTILLEDPNVLTRKDALDRFFKGYQKTKGFHQVVLNLALNSPHPDVVQAIFKFMVEAKDHDLRFFIRVIDEAAVQNRPALANIAFQALGDLITNDPTVLDHLSPRNFTNAKVSTAAPYGQVSPEMAKKAFLSFLMRAPENSIARDRFLQSQFWTAGELAGIFNQLSAYAAGQQLASLIHDTLLRQKALESVDVVFSKGPKKLRILDSDLISYVQIDANGNAVKSFLTTSPQWRKMEKFIHPDLYAKAKEVTDDLLSSAPRASGRNGAPFYAFASLPPDPSDQDALGYFNNLGIEGQQEYISTSQNMPQLAQVLASPTFSRATVLERLMANPQGRILVLQTYLGSDDPELLDMIDGLNWLETIKGDVSAVKDPGTSGTIRGAMEKMHQRTNEEWPLNIRLASFSGPELHAANDVRGPELRDAQIKVEALRRALDVQEERTNYEPLWAGYEDSSPQERSLIGEIRDAIDNTNDPREVEAYLDELQANAADPSVRDVIREVRTVRDQIARELRANDQGVPKLINFEKYNLAVAGLFGLGFVVKKYRDRGLKRRMKLEDRVNSLRRLLVKDTNSDSIIEPIGKIYPRGNTLVGPAQDPLDAWHRTVSRWKSEGSLSNEDLIDDFNDILKYAFEVLQLLRYSPDLMESNNDAYKNTLNYYDLLANDTLIIFERHVQKADLSETQRVRLLQYTKVLLQSTRYVARYTRILSARGILDKVMGKKFADDKWQERSGLNPLGLWYQGFYHQWKKSEALIKKELPSLLQEGNILMPGFYENTDQIVRLSETLLDRMIKTGKTFTDSGQPEDRQDYRRTNFWSQMRALSTPAVTFGAIVATAVGFPGVSVGLSLYSAGGYIYNYLNYWEPNLKILRMGWNQEMNGIIDQMDGRITQILDPKREYRSTAWGSEQQVVHLAIQEGIEEVYNELGSKDPRVDMIVIIPENEQSVGEITAYAQSKRNLIIRAGLPVVEVMSFSHGDADAYLNAVQAIKAKFLSGAYKGKYPKLRPWEEARVMFVFTGKDVDHDERLLELGIINGYRVAGSMEKFSAPGKSRKSQHILISTQDANFGPIPQLSENGITFMTSRVNRDELKKNSFIFTNSTRTGDSSINGIRVDLDLQQLQRQETEERERGKLGSNTYKYFETRGYDPSNAHFKQFLAVDGITVLGPDAVRAIEEIASRLEASDLRQRIGHMDLISDIFNLFIKFNNISDHRSARDQMDGEHEDVPESIKDYVLNRSGWADLGSLKNGKREDMRQALTELYELIRKSYTQRIEVNASVTNPSADLLVHVTTQEDGLKKYKHLLEIALHPSATQTEDSPLLDVEVRPATPGGLDLSKTRENTRFQHKGNPSSSDSNAHIPSIDPLHFKSFQGFEFYIIQFQPIADPAKFLLGFFSDRWDQIARAS